MCIRDSAYTILTLILISIVAVTFAFPLYWIITGSFKTGAAINSTTQMCIRDSPWRSGGG